MSARLASPCSLLSVPTWLVVVACSLCSAAVVAAGVQYIDVTVEAGIDFVYIDGSTGEKYMPEGMGSGAAFFDYDDDGYLDLYILNGAPFPGYEIDVDPVNALYRSNRDGSFTDVTEATGVGNSEYGMGVAVGDYDNDGDRDLYVTNVGPNALYRNDAAGTFSEIATAAGVDDSRWGTSAAFVDYDNDGDLDLYAANYLAFSVDDHRKCWVGVVHAYCAPTVYPGQSGVLYRNDGAGSFADITAVAGLYNTTGRQLAIVFGDYDDDGDQDLFIANDKTPNFLFSNNGDGTFSERGLVAGVAYSAEGEPESAMGADFGDFDNDGRLDIIVATYQWVPNTLYRNLGSGFFSDITLPARLGAASLPFLGMTAAFLDFDNDGHLDIFVANGHLDKNVKEFDPAADYRQTNQLFRNNRDGTFSDVSVETGSGLAYAKVSHGAAFGDYDNDGDVDIFVSDSGGESCQLLRNDGGSKNHYLTVRLVGSMSNRDGIGARIRAVAGDLIQVREVRRGYGYLSSSDGRILFGLGGRSEVDSLEVRWPSGAVQVLGDIPADQLLVLHEEGR